MLFQDIFRLLSPGGGGFGHPEASDTKEDPRDTSIPPKRRRIIHESSLQFTERGSIHEYKMAQESA